MCRSGKGIQNCVFYFIYLFFFFFIYLFFFLVPVPQILEMCCFIVFKIHVKTVNRKSLMVHVFTSVYGFLFSFLSVIQFTIH